MTPFLNRSPETFESQQTARHRKVVARHENLPGRLDLTIAAHQLNRPRARATIIIGGRFMQLR
jgi:hypothetical protein